MLGTQDIKSLIGQTVHGSDGEKIGTVGQVYLDDETQQPQFITVSTGMLGTSESFVPVEAADATADGVTVPYDKDKVKNAPNVDTDGHISPEEEQQIFTYYGLAYGDGRTDVETGTGTVGHDTSGPTTDQAMTRSEEQLEVGKERQEAGRARLRKWVETEQESVTVPVSKERAVVHREPVTEENYAESVDGPEITEREHEVVLNEERAVVDKTVTPVERVRLDKETVTEQQTVSDEVRKEQIEVDGDSEAR